MRNKLEKLVRDLVEAGYCEEDNREIILYGLISATELVSGIITILFISAILGLILECIIFLVSFWAIRTYSGGFHCKSAIICYLASCSTVTLTLLVVKFLPENYVLFTSGILSVFSIPILVQFSPLETPTKPLDGVERKYFKKKALLHLVVESVVISLLIAIGQKVLAFTICLAVFLSSMVLVAELVRRKFARGGSRSGDS